MRMILESVDEHVQHKLDVFNSSLRSNLRNYVANQIHEVYFVVN